MSNPFELLLSLAGQRMKLNLEDGFPEGTPEKLAVSTEDIFGLMTPSENSGDTHERTATWKFSAEMDEGGTAKLTKSILTADTNGTH